jgi:hypothetical protein
MSILPLMPSWRTVPDICDLVLVRIRIHVQLGILQLRIALKLFARIACSKSKSLILDELAVVWLVVG